MADFLRHDLICGIAPLQDPKPGDEAPFVPDALAEDLFGKTDGDGNPVHVYAVLDAAKVQFLSERLERNNLPHACLYTGKAEEDYGEVAPWLVQLTSDAQLTRHFFAHDPDQDNPWYMLAIGAGILLRSVFDLDQVQHHLRRYTLLVDEEGVRQFFRFQEPGFLDAVLQVSDQVEIASFFARIQEVLYLMPALDDGLWDAVRLTPAHGLAKSDGETYQLPVIDKTRRWAMQRVLNTRQGRDMAIRGGTPMPEREIRAKVYTRLMNAGFDNESTLIRTHDLLAQIPADAHASIWQAIESGDHSLGFLNYKIARHYNLEMELI